MLTILEFGNNLESNKVVSALKVPISSMDFIEKSDCESAEKNTKCSLHIPFTSE
jgi:hypothetical protein